jgi:hypothetical protein
MLKMVHYPITNNIISIGIKSTELDNLLAETIAYLNILHPDYGKLAARVAVTKLHKETHESFKDVIDSMYHYTESNGRS